MHQEKYSLTWHTYSDHLKSMMKELMMNEDYSDVTLVTEDKKQIKANISILSACSPIFREILKKEKNSSTIMYLRGVQYSEIESIIQFIYLGEATFYEERMDEFLAVAKSLEIKEICNTVIDTNYELEIKEPCNTGTNTNDELDIKEPCDTDTNDEHLLSDPVVIVASTEKMEEHNVTSYTNEKGDLSVNVNRKYECEKCQKSYSTRPGLYKHKLSVHEVVMYGCDLCDYQAPLKYHLTRHIQSKHNRVPFACR